MRITITARRFKLPENIKNYTQREVMRLEKYYDGIIDAEVVLSWEKFYRMAEIKMRVFGTTLTSQNSPFSLAVVSRPSGISSFVLNLITGIYSPPGWFVLHSPNTLSGIVGMLTIKT